MSTNLLILDAIKKFVSHLNALGRSNNTIIAYQGDLNQFSDYLSDKEINRVDQIEADEIKRFKDYLLKDKSYTAKTVSRKLNSIKSFFHFLLEEGVIDRDFSRSVKHPKTKNSLPNVFKPIEYRSLRDICRQDKRILAIVELMLQAGLRISEVANLRISDVKEDKLIIRAKNSQDKREIPLNSSAKTAIQEYLGERYEAKKDFLFTTKTGRQLLVRNIRSIINRYFEKAGLDKVKVNDLRNTFIVEQLKAGVPLEIVAKIVGHKRIITTERYLELIEEPEGESIDLKVL